MSTRSTRAPAPQESTGAPASYELVAFSTDGVTSVDVPPQGELGIGRASSSGVKLSHESVSRRHATLRVRGADVSLEDLGSANGTFVRGERVAANRLVPLAPGESFQVGEVVLMLHIRKGDRAYTVSSREYFEARLAEQCERSAEQGGRPFFLLGIHVEGDAATNPARAIERGLGWASALAQLDRNRWAVLLREDAEADVEKIQERLVAALAELDRPAQVRVVVAPRDGRTVTALLARLRDEAAPSDETPRALALASPVMVALERQLEPVARGMMNVLIVGETGVGKAVLARWLHERSTRRDRPFLRLSCTGYSDAALESELFGHEKDANGTASKPGLLETAAGGTVFLDEIGELSAPLQAKLLHVLETREVARTGGDRPTAIDVRFVAATNRELEQDVTSGRFRADLFYRLAGFAARLPPLRERTDDILPLAVYFLRDAIRTDPRSEPPGFTDAAVEALMQYPWPGNVRELRNAIERAAALSGGDPIGPEHLRDGGLRREVAAEVVPNTRVQFDLAPKELAERDRIIEALARAAGNQSQAARLLGISRRTLLIKLDAYRVPRPRKRAN